MPVLTLAGLAGCALGGSEASDTPSSPPTTPLPPAELRLAFDDAAAGPGTVLAGTSNSGTADLSIAVATADGGRVIRDRGPVGASARFPATGSRASEQYAALVVRADAGSPALSPGTGGFRFGAEVRLDMVSESVPGASSDTPDNGDNIVQRGLFEDGSQFKLQLDHAVASCRVAGRRGEVVVIADPPIEREWWYRLTCERTADDEVVLSVEQAVSTDAADGWARATTFRGSGTIGDVRLAPEVPLAVGAKLSVQGEIITSASDQFNGALDNVFFQRSQ